MRIAGGQIENVVGDLQGNLERIRKAMEWAEEREADVLLLPEMVLTGYPLEDLAVRKDFVRAAEQALSTLARDSGRTTTIVGTIDRVPPRRSWDTRERDLAIGATLLSDGEVRGSYHKVYLPNYEVFDEARNYAPGTEPGKIWRIGEVIVGVSICEDSWSSDGPPEHQAAAGAQVLMIQNASPFELGKSHGRLEHCRRLARRNGLPVVYVNSVGGQDELVFDGGSLVVDEDGELIHRAPQFETSMFYVDIEPTSRHVAPQNPVNVHTRPTKARPAQPPGEPIASLEDAEEVWLALVQGTRDFAHENGHTDAIFGISGGIDSAVTAALAADALGPDHVLAVSLPVESTPAGEVRDAERVVDALGIQLESIAIDRMMTTVSTDISGILERRPAGTVRRDLLSRIRGTVLLALADQLGYLTLATVNKTELSLGSASLHGDMAGEFAPLKDCPKSLLYSLARHRNAVSPAIPESIIERTPSTLAGSALAFASFDHVDPILERRLEDGAELEELIATGFDPETVRGILQLVDDSEQQRRQSPPGVKITRRSFGKDRRMPITSAWRPYRREQQLLAPGVAMQHGPPAGPPTDSYDRVATLRRDGTPG